MMKKLLLASLIAWAGWANTAHARRAIAIDDTDNCTELKGQIGIQGLSSNRVLSPDLTLSLAWPHLQYAFAKAKASVEEVTLHELSHDDNSYKLQMVVSQMIFWDTLQLQLDFPAANKLRLRLLDNWIPSGLILDRLGTRLKTALEQLPMTLTQTPDSLEIAVDQNALTKLPAQLAKSNFKGSVEPGGRLTLTLAPESSVTSENQLKLLADACGEPDQTLDNDFAAQINLALTPADLGPISVGSEKLVERLQATKGRLMLEGQGKTSLEPLSLNAQGLFKFDLDELEVERKTYTKVQSVPFNWRYSYPDQLEIYPELPEVAPALPALTANKLTLFTQGPAYYSEMMKAVSEARESVEQEIFAYHEGQTTRSLARLYILKAIGLKDSPQGFVPDPYAPDGIRAFLLHNHYLTYKGTREVQHLFDAETDKVFAELAKDKTLGKTPAQINALRERLRQNLRITPLMDGVAHSDHRKLLLIDGRRAYTGGRNLADFYLTEDAYRDVMIRVEGPTVRAMHQAFIDNWEALTPGEKVRWNLRSEAELRAGLPKGQHLSPSAMLLTSRKGWEIQAAMLKLINEAKNTIRLEYAYLYHEPIEAALRAAKARGVEIQLLFSERSDETLFDHLNPATALSLMQAPGPGKVSSWLWQSQGGEHAYMVHTKFMSADGQRAIAGSANLIPRSLQSPFTASGLPLLFNEEIVLYIDDPVFVASLDRELFDKDRQGSREFSAAELKALIDKRGGQLQLLIEKLKGLLA